MERVKKGKFWTARYAMINATYFMGFCGVHAYASVFLLDRGFTNSQIGILLALANVISVLIQPIVAGMIDKQGKLTNRRASAFSTAVIIVCSLALVLIRDKKALIFVIFLLIYMIQMAYQPILTAMYFEYAEKGCAINFGLARGLGSVGFALYSPVLGTLLERYNVSVIHIGDVLVLTVGLLFLLTFKLPEKWEITVKKDGKQEEEKSGEDLTPHNRFWDFAGHYPRFMLFLLATILIYFAHNMINDYMFQIISPLGGTGKHIGYATALAAVLELPTMAFYNKLAQKISCERLLMISTVCFTVKVTLLFFARDLVGVFVSQFCQIGAYALFTLASAYYVNRVMEKFDQVKGQAYLNCAITLSGTFSGLVCGRILDVAGPSRMLGCGVAASLVGTVLAVAVVRKK